MSKLVSVVIATYNSAKHSYFDECIESVVAQDCVSDAEIIVVDGGSDDGTIEIARAYGAIVLNNPRRTELGRGGGKDLALRSATGEFVAIVDADNILREQTYLSDMIRPMRVDSGISMTVPAVEVPDKGQFSSVGRYFCLLERDYWRRLTTGGVPQDGWTKFTPNSIVVPNGALIRRQLLLNLGGWDYDTEVGHRLLGSGNGTFAYVPYAHRLHKEMKGYAEVWRKVRRRVRNHVLNSDVKPTVEHKLRGALRSPWYYVWEELLAPLGEGMRANDLTYLNAIPVFSMKSAILLIELRVATLARYRPSVDKWSVSPP